jgi:hypothetical protein
MIEMGGLISMLFLLAFLIGIVVKGINIKP